MEQVRVFIKMKSYGFLFILLYHVWCICRVYNILPNFLVTYFNIEKVDAGIRLRIIVVATIFRQLADGLVISSHH